MAVKKTEKDMTNVSTLFSFDKVEPKKTIVVEDKTCDHQAMYDALVNDFNSLKWGWKDTCAVVKCPTCKHPIMLDCNREIDQHIICVYRRYGYVRLTTDDKFIEFVPYIVDEEEEKETEEKPDEEESEEDDKSSD